MSQRQAEDRVCADDFGRTDQVVPVARFAASRDEVAQSLLRARSAIVRTVPGATAAVPA